jgi:hypothetical protein
MLALFPLGQIVATPGALAALERAKQPPTLNVFSDEDAAAQLSILRAIASSDLHNLVFRADYRIVPAVTANRPTHIGA